MTTDEAASLLHIAPETLRKWCRSKKISYVRLSKVDIRFRQQDLDEFIHSRLQKRRSPFK
jgi:excisionase family DNA binding protein